MATKPPAKHDVRVVLVSRGETRSGDPMWIMTTDGGDRLYVFGNELDKVPWDNSGYVPWLTAMESGDTERWETFPIDMLIVRVGKYPNVQHVSPPRPNARPDRFPAPASVWDLYRSYWETALYMVETTPTVVFDTETTGVSPAIDEIVSIAATVYPNYTGRAAKEHGKPSEYHSLVMPQHPQKLLRPSGKGTCAFDIHGIHPDHLAAAPLFTEAYMEFAPVLEGKLWVCWNADFDVRLLDNLCVRHGLPLIPRLGVWCAMQGLSAMTKRWDEHRGGYKWSKLEYMAKLIGEDFSDAHDARADVDMTIKVLQWAAQQVKPATEGGSQ